MLVNNIPCLIPLAPHCDYSWHGTTPGPRRSWAESRRLLLARDYSWPVTPVFLQFLFLLLAVKQNNTTLLLLPHLVQGNVFRCIDALFASVTFIRFLKKILASYNCHTPTHQHPVGVDRRTDRQTDRNFISINHSLFAIATSQPNINTPNSELVSSLSQS